MDCKFIFSHKDITCPAGYETVDNRNSVLDHRLWSEWAGIDSVCRKFDTVNSEKTADKTGNTHPEFPPVWVQTNHYRRTIDPDCYGRTYVAQPVMLNCSVAQQYAACHFVEDLVNMGNAIKELYPHMVQVSEQVLNGNVFIPYNIVNCQYGQFRDWTEFVFKILNKVAEYMGNPDYEKMKEIISKREIPQAEKRNNDVAYQCRLYSFLSERLSTIYWIAASKRMPVFPACILKDKEVI